MVVLGGIKLSFHDAYFVIVFRTSNISTLQTAMRKFATLSSVEILSQPEIGPLIRDFTPYVCKDEFRVKEQLKRSLGFDPLLSYSVIPLIPAV